MSSILMGGSINWTKFKDIRAQLVIMVYLDAVFGWKLNRTNYGYLGCLIVAQRINSAFKSVVQICWLDVNFTGIFSSSDLKRITYQNHKATPGTATLGIFANRTIAKSRIRLSCCIRTRRLAARVPKAREHRSCAFLCYKRLRNHRAFVPKANG